jgi:hypothetical protein
MKKVASVFLMLCFFYACKAQTGLELIKTSDSLAVMSRAKADTVLRHFDKMSGAKLLYSLRNSDYYIITKEQCCYKEYFVTMDSSYDVKIRNLKSRKQGNKFLSKSFELDKYHKDIITRIPDATYVRGEPSYFVVKDEIGKRYGEFSLSSLTLPVPIDGKLYGYLLRRLSEEAAKQNKSSD